MYGIKSPAQSISTLTSLRDVTASLPGFVVMHTISTLTSLRDVTTYKDVPEEWLGISTLTSLRDVTDTSAAYGIGCD